MSLKFGVSHVMNQCCLILVLLALAGKVGADTGGAFQVLASPVNSKVRQGEKIQVLVNIVNPKSTPVQMVTNLGREGWLISVALHDHSGVEIYRSPRVKAESMQNDRGIFDLSPEHLWGKRIELYKPQSSFVHGDVFPPGNYKLTATFSTIALKGWKLDVPLGEWRSEAVAVEVLSEKSEKQK